MISKVPYNPAAPLPEVHLTRSFEPLPGAPAPSQSFKTRLRDWARRLFR